MSPSPNCPDCRGSGYVDGPTEYETVLGEQHPYTTVVPCGCTRPRDTRPASQLTLED